MEGRWGCGCFSFCIYTLGCVFPSLHLPTSPSPPSTWSTHSASCLASTPPLTPTSPFKSSASAVLGPPEVSVSGCGNCLLLHIRVPTTWGQLKDFYRGLILHVQRTRDGVQFTLSVPYKEEHMIAYLQPGVEYCVSVSVTSLSNTNPVSSQPHCAFTSPPPSRSSLHVVFGLLAAFCALGFLVTGLVIYGGQLSYELLRQCLPRTLVTDPTSYILLQCQTGGSAPVKFSDCSSTEEQL
ncbi:interferon alpha/beta receptor 2-like isoform X4 [Sander lucioperca]|uniref:interferon alpha/beta receptor 2-like isoform X4 n=1 Tax=Sander lucioperca TaxID=283035 RepID=UPI00125E526C|nr:interferon alpha/beta receptor 2-like isoform X4 [Sander lucioperca]